MRWNFIVATKLKRHYFQFALGVGIVLALVAFGSIQPFSLEKSSKKGLEPVTHGNPNQAKIAFACNVFWGEDILPDMLKIFAQKDVKITFFIGGSWAKKNPEIVKSIAELGHELGNHTYSHPHPNNLSGEQNKEQILKTENLIEDIAGIKTKLYAPPYGEYNEKVLEAAQETGYTTIMWSIDTIDWKKPPADLLKKRVLGKLHNGAIVLMHPTEPTLEALPDLIEEIKSRGYTISTVSDIIDWQ